MRKIPTSRSFRDPPSNSFAAVPTEGNYQKHFMFYVLGSSAVRRPFRGLPPPPPEGNQRSYHSNELDAMAPPSVRRMPGSGTLRRGTLPPPPQDGKSRYPIN